MSMTKEKFDSLRSPIVRPLIDHPYVLLADHHGLERTNILGHYKSKRLADATREIMLPMFEGEPIDLEVITSREWAATIAAVEQQLGRPIEA